MTTVVNRAEAAERAVRERTARLEHELGDLDDPGNPLGADHILAADGRQQLLPVGERVLDTFGLNAEFVPRELGGRLDRLDVLARILRAVFRRDASLGLGYGMTSYLAAAVVWAGGSGQQRRRTADLLLSGGRMACAYPEPAPGNDFLHNRLTAVRDAGGHRLDGRKEALNNAARADALVVFAHTPEAGDDASTAFLLPGPRSGGEGVALLPRRRTSGIRGCVVQGLEFTAHRLGPGRMLGAEGAARRSPNGSSPSPAPSAPRWRSAAPTPRCAPPSPSPGPTAPAAAPRCAVPAPAPPSWTPSPTCWCATASPSSPPGPCT